MRKIASITLFVILVVMPFITEAQDSYKIKGKIVAANGEGLSGARVNQKDTYLFAYTNENGEFEYTATDENAVVTVTLEGYNTYKAKAGSDFSNVILYKDVKIKRSWQLQFSFLEETMSADTPDALFEECTSNYGAGFTFGKTFYFKGRPSSRNIVKFGITADWLNAGYSYYEFNDIFYDQTINSNLTHINAGMQLGGTLTFFPQKLINIQLYGKYSPCYSLMNLKYDEISATYSGFTNGYAAGANISIGFFGVGVEYRSHSGTYAPGGDELYGDRIPAIGQILSSEPTINFTGYRAYITFKF